jgi:hypothetical protein
MLPQKRTSSCGARTASISKDGRDIGEAGYGGHQAVSAISLDSRAKARAVAVNVKPKSL